MVKNFMNNEIENVTKTFQPGELVLLAGRPGSGMTALTAEMTEYLVSEKSRMLFSSLYNMRNRI